MYCVHFYNSLITVMKEARTERSYYKESKRRPIFEHALTFSR